MLYIHTVGLVVMFIIICTADDYSLMDIGLLVITVYGLFTSHKTRVYPIFIIYSICVLILNFIYQV